MVLAVYALENLPSQDTGMPSIFLAGPTPRKENVVSWRPDALKILGNLNFHGAVFIPEPRNGVFEENKIPQAEWEDQALRNAHNIVFWVPRDMKTMPALTTNIEWGRWESSGKVVLGYPEGTPNMWYMTYYAHKHGVPVFHTLHDTLFHVVQSFYGQR